MVSADVSVGVGHWGTVIGADILIGKDSLSVLILDCVLGGLKFLLFGDILLLESSSVGDLVAV